MSSVRPARWGQPEVLESSHAALASGCTDPGIQRDVNEDRVHCDTRRGLFMVIDGVGGQAAGGKAADIALTTLRETLERAHAPSADRIRDGITIANNEIFRLAGTRPEWEGMACVLTVVVLGNGTATFGHVGDTRLYKLHGSRIEKLTRDHSPVGEREDARELSEHEAMRHPRRNEVYRDVGSEPHHAADRDFIDVGEVTVEPDAALLLCSDGLTDQVDSAFIARTVRQLAGDPGAVVRALVDAANAAGGKDNVTVVYVEGERFAAAQTGERIPPRPVRSRPFRAITWVALVGLLLSGAGIGLARARGWELGFTFGTPASQQARPDTHRVTVPAGGSIAAALRDALPGSEVIVEPGEYREQLTLKDGVRVVSREPRAASIRLPAAVPDAEQVPAVIARNVSDAELVGFKISGDAATPLAIGILVQNALMSIVDVEISGARQAAVEFSGGTSTLIGSEIHDNPGAAIVVRDGGAPRISHNAFLRNGTSEHAAAPFVIAADSAPAFRGNVFSALTAASITTLERAIHVPLRRDNWVWPVPAESPRRPAAATRSGRAR